MIVTKKCVVCGFEFSFDDVISSNIYVSPNSEGAKLYFNLWHYNVEKCPKCGFACKDVSTCLNNSIINDSNYQKIAKNAIVDKLEAARPNKLGDYLQAAMYYRSIGDKLNEALCTLQSSDIIYGELIYWQDFIFEDSTLEDLEKDADYIEFNTLANELYNKSIRLLKEYLKEKPRDLDYIILLAGVLSDGNKMQKIESVNLLNKLKSVKSLTNNQKLMIKFLIDMVRD